MAYNDLKEIYKDFASDKPMKWIIRLLGATLVVIVVTVAIKGVMGRHVRFLGIEMNMPEGREKEQNPLTFSREDTAKPESDPVYKKDFIIKNDSLLPVTPLTKKNLKKITTKPLINDTDNKIQVTQQNSNSGTNNGIIGQKNVNYGTNNGVIGDNNNIFGKIKEHPSEKLLDQIEKALPNKDERINIMALTTGAGSSDFAAELEILMRKRGYNKLSIGIGQIMPLPPKGITLQNMQDVKTLLVNVD